MNVGPPFFNVCYLAAFHVDLEMCNICEGLKKRTVTNVEGQIKNTKQIFLNAFHQLYKSFLGICKFVS